MASGDNLRAYRRKVRKHLDSGKIDPATAGLFLDLYEIFAGIAEEAQREMAVMEMMKGGPPPGFEMFKMSTADLEKAVKRDKKKAPTKKEAGTGQYL